MRNFALSMHCETSRMFDDSSSPCSSRPSTPPPRQLHQSEMITVVTWPTLHQSQLTCWGWGPSSSSSGLSWSRGDWCFTFGIFLLRVWRRCGSFGVIRGRHFPGVYPRLGLDRVCTGYHSLELKLIALWSVPAWLIGSKVSYKKFRSSETFTV